MFHINNCLVKNYQVRFSVTHDTLEVKQDQTNCKGVFNIMILLLQTRYLINFCIDQIFTGIVCLLSCKLLIIIIIIS